MATPLIVNEERHSSNWTLAHFFAQSNYFVVTYSSGRVTAVTSYTDNTLAHVLRNVALTYNVDGSVHTITKTQYDPTTYALVETMTGTLAYSSGNVANITWVRS